MESKKTLSQLSWGMCNPIIIFFSKVLKGWRDEAQAIGNLASYAVLVCPWVIRQSVIAELLKSAFARARKIISLPLQGNGERNALKMWILSLIFSRKCCLFAAAGLRSEVQVLASKTLLCWTAQDIIFELTLEQTSRVKKGMRAGKHWLCWKIPAATNKDISEPKVVTKP